LSINTAEPKYKSEFVELKFRFQRTVNISVLTAVTVTDAGNARCCRNFLLQFCPEVVTSVLDIPSIVLHTTVV